MEGKWHVGMRRGHNANCIYEYTAEQEFNDPAVATVFGLPQNMRLDEIVKEPRYAEALQRAYLIASAPRLAQEHAEMRALLEDWEHACRLVPDIGHLRGKTVALLAKMKDSNG